MRLRASIVALALFAATGAPALAAEAECKDTSAWTKSIIASLKELKDAEGDDATRCASNRELQSAIPPAKGKLEAQRARCAAFFKEDDDGDDLDSDITFALSVLQFFEERAVSQVSEYCH